MFRMKFNLTIEHHPAPSAPPAAPPAAQDQDEPSSGHTPTERASLIVDTIAALAAIVALLVGG